MRSFVRKIMNKNLFWKACYSRWNKVPKKLNSGYSILLMVPGDLPVFMQIAMEQCASQDSGHLSEVIVVPDNIPPGFMPLFESLQKKWTKSPMKLALLNQPEFFMTKKMNNPHLNCWLQFIRGCNAVKTRYLLWHDADLFITKKDFLEEHYGCCFKNRYALLGLNEAWDAWYRENGFSYLTSTWEIMLDMEWVRSFKPWQHRGHDGLAGGKPHTFDITFLPQCLTEPSKIQRHQGDWGFVHFNYVIGTYRRFQNSRGPFEDNGFKVLFVRLLADAYDRSGWKYEAPAFEDLLKGVRDSSARVTYLLEDTRKNYPEFRTKFQNLLDSGVSGREREVILKERILRFDEAMGWKQ